MSLNCKQIAPGILHCEKIKFKVNIFWQQSIKKKYLTELNYVIKIRV